MVFYENLVVFNGIGCRTFTLISKRETKKQTLQKFRQKQIGIAHELAKLHQIQDGQGKGCQVVQHWRPGVRQSEGLPAVAGQDHQEQQQQEVQCLLLRNGRDGQHQVGGPVPLCGQQGAVCHRKNHEEGQVHRGHRADRERSARRGLGAHRFARH